MDVRSDGELLPSNDDLPAFYRPKSVEECPKIMISMITHLFRYEQPLQTEKTEIKWTGHEIGKARAP